jgi:hypothetical protein
MGCSLFVGTFSLLLVIMGAKYDSWIDYGIIATCTIICALIAIDANRVTPSRSW